MIPLIAYVVGGLALFLYGMKLATDGLREAAGGKLRATLSVLTARKPTAILSGVVVTFLLSSSSAVAVMLIELSDAGLLSLARAIFVLLGAAVGIALTVELITLPVAQYALFAVAAGVIIRAAARYRRGRALGSALIGAGLLFFGLDLINKGVGGAADQTVKTLGPWLNTAAVGFLLGLLLAAFIRSAAAVGLAVVLAGNGVPVEQLIPVVLGSTVGTCSVPLLAGIQASPAGRRVAVAELIFRLVPALACLFVVRPAAEFSTWLTSLTGFGAGDFALQRHAVANAMLLLALLTVIVWTPLAGALAALLTRAVGRKSGAERDGLAAEVSEDPATAVADAHAEVVRMADIVRDLVTRSTRAVIANDERELERLEADDERVDAMDHLLTKRLEELAPVTIPSDSADVLEVKVKLLYIIKDLEAMADVATRDLVHVGWEKSRDNVDFDADQKREIENTWRLIDEDLGRLVLAVRGEDSSELARAGIIEGDRAIDLKRLDLFERQSARVAAGAPGAEESSEPYMNVVNALRIVHFHAADVVRAISEPKPGTPRIGATDATRAQA